VSDVVQVVSDVVQSEGEPLLSVKNLVVHFGAFAAVQNVTFDLRPGETLGLVGESGSGKSTLARAILRLIPATSGSVFVGGKDLLSCRPSELRRRRRDLQMVFQDPLASLNPRMSVGAALAEPLEIHEPSLSASLRAARVAEMLERVGLSPATAARHPHEFSGGQCQRIGIARAMILRPKLLVCDEPVSSLDVSIQGQIVNLLADLQREFGTAMLFISHNLAVIRHLSHRVLVIYRGRLVEVADRDALFGAPAHPYTRALLAAVPDPTRVPEALPVVEADVAPFDEPPADEPPFNEPAAAAGRSGCDFFGRCAYAQDQCRLTAPPLNEIGARHAAACHRWREVVYSCADETRNPRAR
jgi:oligopeptide transport system ATP-binding protein